MKRLLYLPLLLLLLTCAALGAKAQSNAAATGRTGVYGVAFYNLENLFDTIPNNPLGRDEEFTPDGSRKWTGKKYWSKISNLAYCISNMVTKATPMGPAVIGVSEIENRSVLEDLVKDPAIAAWGLQICHHDSPDRRGVDVGLLYNPRLFRLVDVNNYTLDIGYPTRDQMVVTGIFAGTRDTVNIIVNHWPSRLGGEEKSSPNREAAAALCLKIANDIWAEHPDQGVIIMGDLNDDPMNKSCAEVLGARKKMEGLGPHDFFNPFWSILEDKGIGTLAYKSQWNLFDQIIVSGNLLPDNARKGNVEYRSAKVNNFDFLLDTEGDRKGYPLRTYSGGVWLNGYSDHFPTEIFLRIKK